MLLVRLSLRNLFRQKRRNLLLGSAMALGVVLLVVANSFSRGLSDIMINKVMRWVSGHVTIVFNERSHVMSEVFRDKQRIDAILQDFKDVILEQEEAIGVFLRAIGNGKADNLILVGVDLSQEVSQAALKEIEESFRMVEGRWEELENPQLENPVIISLEKAQYLNVKLHDVLRLRLRNFFGQDQSARATVVGMIKNANIFMQPVMFMEVKKVKPIVGFDSHSTGNINIVVKDPKRNARLLADAIHSRLKPGLALISGFLVSPPTKQQVTVLGFRSEPALKPKLAQHLSLLSGSLENAWKEKTALVAQPLAQAAGWKVGSHFTVRYTDKWGNDVDFSSQVAGIFAPQKIWGPRVILLQDERFYDTFYLHWPKSVPSSAEVYVPAPNHLAYDCLAPEWILLPRTLTTEELEKKYKDMAKNKWKATLIDVRTMYESASQPLKLEGVLNLITLSAVLILFVIILLGVVNTLRMTIRERTREIGTLRAIGMQRQDVRNLFLLETFFLALFASLIGAALALLLMWGLGNIQFPMDDNPLGMFLINQKLYFLPTLASMLANMALILFLAVVTAYFPARRASKLTPGAALRHFE